MYVGHGFDAHRFAENKPLILGGVHIPCSLGLDAHSDGDVLIHAFCDALLGAASLGDIGMHFPDTDNTFSGISSRILLRSVINKLRKNNLDMINADITLIAQIPKLKNYINSMKTNLIKDLYAKPRCINIKATTTDYMGYIGRKEGIACHTLVLLSSKK